MPRKKPDSNIEEPLIVTEETIDRISFHGASTIGQLVGLSGRQIQRLKAAGAFGESAKSKNIFTCEDIANLFKTQRLNIQNTDYKRQLDKRKVIKADLEIRREQKELYPAVAVNYFVAEMCYTIYKKIMILIENNNDIPTKSRKALQTKIEKEFQFFKTEDTARIKHAMLEKFYERHTDGIES